MTPQEGNSLEADGVLNPASGRGPDGEWYLLPRLVAIENVSRVGLVKVIMDDGGVPASVERLGVDLPPMRGGSGSGQTRGPRTRGPHG